MIAKFATGFLLLVAACWPAPGILAQPAAPRIEELSPLDATYMEEQRVLLGDLAALKLGRQFSGDRDRDLDLLQALLDERLVRPDQTRELQAMGIILGDLLAAEYGLHWAVYRDNLGRSRALRYRDSDFFLFPVTMIAQRRETGDDTPVADVYRMASDIVKANTPALPFQ